MGCPSATGSTRAGLAVVACAAACLHPAIAATAIGRSDRPILLHFYVTRGRGSPRDVEVQVLMPQRRPVHWLTYPLPFARWHPTQPIVAFLDDNGLERVRYYRDPPHFGEPHEIRIRWPTAPRWKAITFGSGLLDPAWFADGRSMVAEFFPSVGIEVLSLVSGRTRLVVPALELGRNNPFGTTSGTDASPDGKLIAYSVQGTAPVFKGGYDTERVDVQEDPGTHCDLWLVDRAGKRTLLGHGSRPRFSRDGQFLLALDRADDQFRLDLRLYDLRSKPIHSKVVLRNVAAACFSQTPARLLVVRKNGDLVETSLGGVIRRTILTGSQILERQYFPRGGLFPWDPGNYPIGPIMRADVDW